MLTSYLRLREYGHRLVPNERGVVSFEYVIVAACIVGSVVAAFGTDAGGNIGAALVTAIGKITTAVASAA